MIVSRVLTPAVAALVCCIAPSLSAQTEAVISAGSTSVTPGNTFDIPVNISSITDLHNFQFNLFFDPNVLQLESVSEGPFLASAGSTTFFPGFIDNTSGTVTLILDSLVSSSSGANGSGTLANFSFESIGIGSSTLDLSGVYLQDSSLSGIPFTISNGGVTVVPEPRAWTWIVPLLGVLLLARSKRSLRRAA
jgi:hypothetical protein